MPYQVPPFDVASIFLAAQQARANQQSIQMNDLKLAEMQREQDAAAMAPDYREAYFNGDPSQMQRHAPQEYIKLQQAGADLQRTQAQTASELLQINKNAAEISRTKAIRTATTLTQAIDSVQKNPAIYPQVREQLGQLAQQGVIELNPQALPEQLTPEQMPGLDQVKQQMSVMAQSMQDPKYTNDMVEIATARGLNLNDPMAFQDPGLQEEMRKRNAQPRGTQVTVVNGQPTSALTTGTQAQIQKEMYETRKKLDQLAMIRKSIMDVGGFKAMSDTFNKWSNTAAGMADKTKLLRGLVTDEMRQTMGKRAAAIAAMSGIVNQIINELSGANVPPSEMERMVQSLPTPDDPGDVMEAKLNITEQNLRIIERNGIEALGHGVSLMAYQPPGSQPQAQPQTKPAVAPMTPPTVNRAGAAQPSAQAPNTRTQDVLARLKAGMASGSKPGEILQAMVKDGVIDESEATKLLALVGDGNG